MVALIATIAASLSISIIVAAMENQTYAQTNPCMRNWQMFNLCAKTQAYVQKMRYCSQMAIINNFPGSENRIKTWDPYCQTYR
jgi:hypothetical protein